MENVVLVVHLILALSLIGAVLMQRSEGGGLGVGGSPSGLMSARGAADFMTRLTSILAALFVITAIALAVVASNRGHATIDDSFERSAPADVDAPAVIGDDAVNAAGANDGIVTPADAALTGEAPAEEVPVTR